MTTSIQWHHSANHTAPPSPSTMNTALLSSFFSFFLSFFPSILSCREPANLPSRIVPFRNPAPNWPISVDNACAALSDTHEWTDQDAIRHNMSAEMVQTPSIHPPVQYTHSIVIYIHPARVTNTAQCSIDQKKALHQTKLHHG
ncbi:unnamed protein product [Tuber aestivum]|uniref:Uncharacterized protein n=1 Tax=Tuber aestivum TaxID=59557 RepID=A0A292Q897_9PEZI|nr:unnamed protein product [Tuber aestivum]